MRGKLFCNELMLSLSDKYNKSISQIILKCHIQRGVVPIPKSSNEDRIKEKFNIFDFELSDSDMTIINSLNEEDNFSVLGVP
ncbi:aldo/keto reductase [Clostridium sp. D53t1_180928_C8]|uniref:aldo/keto reductase n=1 Tax=Clostridium sp. D53t1_180928_C8 TaxID=2787101 RepID=UPI0018AA2C9A|nr:aldo/keto reductase [Clostridium sp. D53t1_180928_C8]